YHKNPIAYGLDVVVLGASEIDLDFNVNVTTDSNNLLIGGSGGHADTANGAKVSIIVTSLLKGRMPTIRKHVTTITTPGETVDVLVTERGIAINPKRPDLIQSLEKSALDIVTIETLMDRAHQMSGKPLSIPHEGRPIGLVRYFDGTIIDVITQRK
ncbi:MAG: citrate lyase subunit alpha, partial [Acholeplasmataceae bacterium]|nr:citrate lyase subunit alpha [Acholeplasmataceae bacterium]